jgi:hypothetical protein
VQAGSLGAQGPGPAPPGKGTGGPGEGGVGQVPLQGNLAVAGRRGAESWEMGGFFPRQRAGLQGVHTLSLQGVGSLQSLWGRWRILPVG